MAEDYDGSFARLCAGAIPKLLDPLGIGDRRRLLDVGTGTGTVAAAAGHRGFLVEAVDAEPTMIDFAREHRGGPGVRFGVGSLPQLDFASGAFDAVTANFVINHTGDPLASLREIGRVVRPGGSVGATIWPVRVSALNAIWSEVMEQADVVRTRIPRVDPALDFARTVDGLRDLMTDAGYSRVGVTEETWTFRIAPDDLWRAVPAGIAVIGIVYRAQIASVRSRMRDAFVTATESALVEGELTLPMTCILGVGTVPATVV